MKRLLFPTVFFVLAFMACDNRPKKILALEKDYEALFEKEYAEYVKSEKFLQFQTYYKELLALADTINKNDMQELNSNEIPAETLCFGHDNHYWQLTSQKEDDYRNNIIKIYPYEAYTYKNEGVNAYIVASEFAVDNGEQHQSKFSSEFDIHKAYLLLDKEKFVAEAKMMDKQYSNVYEELCKARIAIDRLLLSKYIVILKTILFQPSVYDSPSSSEFETGIYAGCIYVYSREKKKIITDYPIISMSSDTVTGLSGNMQTTVHQDFNRNVEKALSEGLDSISGTKGDIPELYLQFDMPNKIF